MDKFFSVLKENGLIMNFFFFCVVFLIIGAELGRMTKQKNTLLKSRVFFCLKRIARRGSFCIFNYSNKAQKKQPFMIASFILIQQES